MVLGGWLSATDPLPLTDKRYLRLTMSLFREHVSAGWRLKMEKSAMQYQIDADGQPWMFRYDYLRYPPEPHPADCWPRTSVCHVKRRPTCGVLYSPKARRPSLRSPIGPDSVSTFALRDAKSTDGQNTFSRDAATGVRRGNGGRETPGTCR